MTREEAVETARAFLYEAYEDDPLAIVIDPSDAVEHPLAWTVLFNSQEAIDTGDWTKAPINRVIVVFKDQSYLGFHPTAFTVEESERWLATGQRPQRLS
jgi:hypothetical protein